MISVFQTEDATKSRLLARLLRDILAAEKFDSIADLTDALKDRCAAPLRIRWTDDAINEAYALIESNRPLLHAPAPPRNRFHVERPDDARPLSRAEAAELWARLCAAALREQRKARP